MPYKKKHYKKKRNYGKYLSTAGKALTVALQVRKLLNVEFKLLDSFATGTAMTVTPIVQQLILIAQGDGVANHDGNQIKSHSNLLRYVITMNTSAVASACRVMLVRDTQPNGATFVSSDLLTDITVFDSIISPIHQDFKHRFKVLYDRRHYLSDSGSKKQSGKHFTKMSFLVRFDDTSANITALQTNSLALVFFSDEATNTPTITFFNRYRFIDN